jgi:glycosyltransferase involved in cell wall biosynthesis
MYEVDCELAESLMRPVEREPVLSVVIPTFSRPTEMIEAVESIASQVDASLLGKVEIIVTDNASGPDTAAALKALADTYPFVNYRINAQNMGASLQIFGAPFRARGRFTWVFGDDDALGPGGLAAIVDILEREDPAFVSVNREVWNPTFDTLVAASKHDLPDRRFDSFLDLLALFGFDQLSFITSQIFATDLTRGIDPAFYRASRCRFAQLGLYIEAYHDRPAYYFSHPVVRHRWNADAKQVHAANFLDLATALPELVQRVADKIGLEPGFFERIGGRRNLVGEAGKSLTFVDNILENLWRSVAIGTFVHPHEWERLEVHSRQWRPDHADHLRTVHQMYTTVSPALEHYQALIAEHQRRVAEGPRTQEDLDMLGQIATAAKSLETELNDARRMAAAMAGQFA